MDMRSSFEIWARGDGLPLDREGPRFRDPRTDDAWRCWQAATRLEREACAVVCDIRTARAVVRHDYDKGYEAAAEVCAREIRSRSKNDRE